MARTAWQSRDSQAEERESNEPSNLLASLTCDTTKAWRFSGSQITGFARVFDDDFLTISLTAECEKASDTENKSFSETAGNSWETETSFLCSLK